MTGLVYTAITGGYDTPKKVFKEPGVEYLLVTDTPGLKAPGWNILTFPKAKDPRALARQTKVCMPLRKGGYDWYLWVDGTMEIVGPVKEFVEAALEQHDFAAWKHPWWQCSYTEINKCLKLKKDARERLERGRGLLLKKGFPPNYGQLATWVLLRKNTDLVRQHAEAWWKDMQATTMRDQVTFMLNLWRVGAKIQWLPGTIDKAKWLKFHRGHKR